MLRVESLFGEPGPGGSRQGSLKGILVRLRAGEQVPVFVDRTVSPGYTTDIAARDARAGRTARRAGRLSLRERRGDELGGHRGGGGPAARPAHRHEADHAGERGAAGEASEVQRAVNAKLAAAGIAMPTWQDALARHLIATGELATERTGE